MSHIKKRDKTTLERIEEELMRQLYETENGCSLHILYLEGNFVPAQYVIMGNIANFINYILQENTD